MFGVITSWWLACATVALCAVVAAHDGQPRMPVEAKASWMVPGSTAHAGASGATSDGAVSRGSVSASPAATPA